MIKRTLKGIISPGSSHAKKFANVAIFENTIEPVTVERETTGVYWLRSNGGFVDGRTFVRASIGVNNSENSLFACANILAADKIEIQVTDLEAAHSDGDDAKIYFEVTVYDEVKEQLYFEFTSPS